MANEFAAAAGCCGCVVCVAFFFCITSLQSIKPTEMALMYNRIFCSVNSDPYIDPGLYPVGPGFSFMKYPKTIQTMEYDTRHFDVLDGRTSDGLPLSLSVAFQYRLIPEKLFQLYDKFENNVGDYLKIYKLFGIHLITEISTNYTAYQFFNEKEKIAHEMRRVMDAYFQERLFATVVSLQINEDVLPEEFTNSVLIAATVKQNISQMEQTKRAKVIEFQTQAIVAGMQANVTVQKANGESYKILQNARADASIVTLQTKAEIESYSKVKDTLKLTRGDDLIKYIWFDGLSGGGVTSNGKDQADVQMLVGVNPSAYISAK